VLALVLSRVEVQTPMLEGDAERRVLGGEPRRPVSAVSVLAVGKDETVLLAAGAPQGIAAGAWFAVHPLGAEDLSRHEERIALVEVTEAGAATSRARVAEVLRRDAGLEPGAPAELLALGGVRLRRSVSVPRKGGPLLRAIAERLADGAAKPGFLEPAADGRRSDFTLAAGAGEAVVVIDRAGAPLLCLERPSGAEAVLAALEHLARFCNVEELANPHPGSDLFDSLAARLDSLPAAPPADWRLGEPLATVPFASLPAILRPGDWFCLTIGNRAVRDLNVAVLDLAADWSIRQVFPEGRYWPLDAGFAVSVPCQAQWPFRQRRGRERFKVFAVAGDASFRWLELAALGEPPLSVPKALPATGLDALFAALGHLRPRQRALAPERQPEHSWTVLDLTWEVHADGA
jgi:hypothetical protein